RDVSIAAPGVDVLSLRARRTDFMRTSDHSPYEPGASYIGSDQRYYVSSGTSFAAPIVSGIASLLWSQSPELSHVQVRRMLEQSARDIESPGKDYLTGYGIVDAQAALAADPEFYIHADIERLGRVEIVSQEFVEVVGSVSANQFGRGWLELGAGEEPTAWRRVGTLLVNPIDRGVLSEFRLDELESGTVWVLRVTVEHVNGKTREVRYRFETGQQ
ncbi:MAG: S8 family serine peptidase, partial [Gammaproteobacteria bacterium]|nr:S8 family serine peptidase [Gammaproteobacteria bacterium]